MVYPDVPLSIIPGLHYIKLPLLKALAKESKRQNFDLKNFTFVKIKKEKKQSHIANK